MNNQVDNKVNVVYWPPGTSLIPWEYLETYFKDVPEYKGNPLEAMPQTQSYIICPHCGERIEP